MVRLDWNKQIQFAMIKLSIFQSSAVCIHPWDSIDRSISNKERQKKSIMADRKLREYAAVAVVPCGAQDEYCPQPRTTQMPLVYWSMIILNIARAFARAYYLIKIAIEQRRHKFMSKDRIDWTWLRACRVHWCDDRCTPPRASYNNNIALVWFGWPAQAIRWARIVVYHRIAQMTPT